MSAAVDVAAVVARAVAVAAIIAGPPVAMIVRGWRQP